MSFNLSPIRVLGISGSLRSKSYNRALLTYAQENAPLGLQIDIFDLHDIPMFSADLEAAGLPTAVAEFRAALFASDAFIFASPEYNASIPGVLKNAIDWASRSGAEKQSPMGGKPALLVGAGGMSGTMRAQLHLRDVLSHNNLHVMNQTLMIPKAWEAFDSDTILSDEPIQQRYQKLLLQFHAWSVRLQPVAQFV